jgi:hypothetical protein
VTEENELHQPELHSQLFTVRLWRGARQTSESDPYMQVKHVLSGETRYFNAWAPLIAYIMGKLDSLHPPQELTSE